ncbi:hypothetical protein V1J52_15810 [Streptomyces sp. TRM 70351]|uniref:DUF6895 family protein n=1 Tax=Streptomyces sp. TRM 70351 TaxID=3116552 RepID=UPI002E7B9177|nr:hypothetical protein [Streptomyces sp. TRM 70351]MEE1929632.1 hypothetical protein [Streptomyces sp. TRM 70351]
MTSATAPGALPAPPTPLIHEVGVRALEWLADHREHFRPRPATDTPEPEIKERFKPVGELAAIGTTLFREGVAGSRQAALARQLLEFAWGDLLDGGGLLAWMQREEPLSPVPLEVYTPFKELGYTNPAVERAAAVSQGLTSWAALEVLPMRRLGIAATEARAGLAPSVPVAEAARRTWLGRTPEPWTLSFHIAYDVTHTVFHLTRWGADPSGLPGDLAGYLDLWLPVWLEDWLAREHWDVLGELLVVDACLPSPTLDAHVWRRFAAAQDPSGAMPIRSGQPQAEDAADLFDLVYHPTLVAAFASTMATSRALARLSGTAG